MRRDRRRRLVLIELSWRSVRHVAISIKLMYLQHHCYNLLPKPGPHTRPHLNRHAPYTPNVDLGIIPALLWINNFWRHPIYGTPHAGMSPCIQLIRSFRDTKIGYLAYTILFNQNIRRFEVLRIEWIRLDSWGGGGTHPMYNAPAVKVFESL